MDATLNALVDLLIKAIPTIIFFLFLTFYLKRTYFQPLARILEQRREQTEGLREISQRAFEAADQKTTEFERALQMARAEIGQENEAQRRQWVQEQADIVAKARSEAEAKVTAARQTVASEVAQAGSEIEASIQPLSEQIIAALSRRRAA